MKKINEIRRNKPVQYAVVALAGLLAGWLLFSPSKNATPETYEGHEMHKGHSHDLIQDETGVWTAPCTPRYARTNPANARSVRWI